MSALHDFASHKTLDHYDPVLDRTEDFKDKLIAHIRHKAFPCVGAKSALARDRITFLNAGDLRCPRHDPEIHAGLEAFVTTYRQAPGPFQSFAVIFDGPDTLDEPTFEKAMWSRLQALEDTDAAKGYAYDPRVSPNADHPEFSLSFAEEAFFIVALHPNASRPARRFDVPVLIFNTHDQFEHLRHEGRYEALRASIIDRDIAFSGSANPMLARHGERSEASQYSGRSVGNDWQCPLRPAHFNTH